MNGIIDKKVFIWYDNYNAKCQLKCQDEGYAIAATQGLYCYCLSTLPVPQLKKADSDLAAGNGGPCSSRCPGVYSTAACIGDECCGGSTAVSVFIVGFIDVLKQLERRVINRIMSENKAKELVLNYHLKDEWVQCAGNTYQSLSCVRTSDFSGPITERTYRLPVHYQSSLSDPQSYQYTYMPVSNFELTFQPHLDYTDPICTVERIKIVADFQQSLSSQQADYFGLDIAFSSEIDINSNLYTPVYNPTRTQAVIEATVPYPGIEGNGITIFVPCQEPPSSSPTLYARCTISKVSLEAWGRCPPQVSSNAPTVSVLALGRTATTTGVGALKVYNLTRVGQSTETLTDIPLAQSPLKQDEKTELRLITMEKLLESDLLVEEKPLGYRDIMCDNFFGGTEITCKNDYTITTTTEETWTTEHGFNIEVTVGAEFEAGTLFTKATTTFEMSTGYSFTSGRSQTKGNEVSATFGVEAAVPAGARMEIRFFKADIPVQVKWRASIFADGYVLARFHHPTKPWLYTAPAKLHLSQLLSHYERTLFAFGTIDYGERPTFIARTKLVDRNGNVLSNNEEEKEAKPALK